VKKKVTSTSRTANVDGIFGVPTPIIVNVPAPESEFPSPPSPPPTNQPKTPTTPSLKNLTPSELLTHISDPIPSPDLSYTIVTCLNLLRSNNALKEILGEKLNFKENILKDIRSRTHQLMLDRDTIDPKEITPISSLKLLKSYIRNDHIPSALKILNVELSESIIERSTALSILSQKYYDLDSYVSASSTVKELEGLGPKLRSLLDENTEDEELRERVVYSVDWTALIQSSGKCESRRRSIFKNARENGGDLKLAIESNGGKQNVVFTVLRSLSTHPSPNTDSIYEALANALVRRTTFLKGSVSMQTLPKPDRGEVAFIGRSNVGKSSLVNMICNRKALAYTSKRPGKTREFNFFAVNDKEGVMKEVRYGDEVRGVRDFDCFYLVDLPGFGYAKVSREQKEEWSEFQKEYFEKRKNLRVVFHLIDSRHGLVSEDLRIMRECSTIFSTKKDVSYVIVLTKADKNDKLGRGKVSKNVMENVRTAMRENGVGGRPIIATSAETKMGRDGMWGYLKEGFK